MTDQSNLFSEGTVETQQPTQPVEKATPTTTANTSPETLFQDQLLAIRNEEGLQKYASAQDALSSIPHREEYLRTLKQEKQAMEQQLLETKLELEKRMSVEDAMSKIASPEAPENTSQTSLGRDDVYSLMKDYEVQKVVQSNRKTVSDTLISQFGSEQKAQEVLTQRLAELKVSKEHLAAIAGESPDAAYRLLGLDGKGTPATDTFTSGTINTDAMESFSNKEVPQSKGIGLGTTSKDLVSEWRNSGEAARQKLNL